MSLNYGLKHNNIFFFQKECNTLVKDKIITFRVSKEEYKEILRRKADCESISEYIRRLIL